MGDNFYVLVRGCVQSAQSQSDDMSPIETILPGGSFGELSLIYSCPRPATVWTTEPSSLWVVDRKSFQANLSLISSILHQS